jgi:ligand-binding SRPBCC domain-containing protein
MHTYTLHCEMVSPQPIETTFAVFEDPYNLSKITPPWLRFQVTSKGQVRMREGAEIEYRIKWLGISMGWKTIIREYCPPNLFVDEQAKGPYRFWRHTHTFEQTSDGTKVSDRVEYRLPFGLVGRLAHRLLVAGQLKGIFSYRQRELARMFAGTTQTTLEPTISKGSS